MIRFEIDRGLGLLTSTWSGTVSDAEALSAYRGLLADPDFELVHLELGDLRAADIGGLTAAGLRALRELFSQRLADEQRDYRTAVVAPEDLTFGVSRMYELLGDDSRETVRVFRDRKEALDWLGVAHGTLP